MAILDLIGSSVTLRPLVDIVDLVAAVDAPVLIEGEMGTGKELVARAIHEASPSQTSEKPTFSFGPFVLVPDRQALLMGNRPVRIGARTLELLTVLVERAGELVTKDELISRVWPDTFVDESNLKVNIAALRRALGDKQAAPRYVATANGRGYRFIAPVESVASVGGAALMKPKHNLPMQTTRVIGRGDAVKAVSDHLTQHRLVTIVGTGGIGKTTVALSVAGEMLNRFEDGIWLVDIAPLREGDLVSRALADALGIKLGYENVVEALSGHLSSQKMLIVLDNCEHLVGPVAYLIDELVQHTHFVHIVATSREPLRVRDEQVYRLPALESPAHSERLTAAHALSYSAIELFLERAAACASYQFTDEDVPVVSDICRRLDGIALAIELAAARMDSIALRELSRLLDDQLTLLNRGRRTAPERHRTLAAALDWSYERLSDKESTLLRRLSIFPSAFLRESASVVAGGDPLSHADIVEALASLVAKSLVTADIHGANTQYRLLDTTRAYASQRLQECGEHANCMRRREECRREFPNLLTAA